MCVCKKQKTKNKNRLQLIMESTSWCVVWFAFPNEDWIQPQPLTVHGLEYAALRLVSMEMLLSCCTPLTTTTHTHTKPLLPIHPQSAHPLFFVFFIGRKIWASLCLRVRLCVRVGCNTNMYDDVKRSRHHDSVRLYSMELAGMRMRCPVSPLYSSASVTPPLPYSHPCPPASTPRY